MVSIGGSKMKEKKETSSIETEKFYNVEECYAMTRIKPSTWRRWILERQIDIVRFGRCVRVPSSEIQRMINKGFCPRLEK